MLNRIRILIVVTVGLLADLSFAGSITHRSFDSRILDREYAYNIYLPDGYETSDLTFPVLYLLHGSFGSEHDWPQNGNVLDTLDRLISAGEIPPALVVMPGTRSWWIDGHNEAAKTAFFEDLIPHIEASYRAIPERTGRLVAGLSAGGYGTVKFVLEHPDRFAAGAAFSPASYVPLPPPNSSAWQHPAYLDTAGEFDASLWEARNYTAHIEAYKQGGVVVPLFITSGDHDVFDIAYHGAVLYQALREHQPDNVEFRVVDGDHEWRVWAEGLPEALVYLFQHAGNVASEEVPKS